SAWNALRTSSGIIATASTGFGSEVMRVLNGSSQQPWKGMLIQRFLFVDYYTLVGRIKPAIETYTDSLWHLDPAEVAEWTRATEHFGQGIKAYEYLAHLRHNGFPAPLLDWTRSPYVAAYFAFSKPQHEYVAIFAFSEMPRKFKSGSATQPEIRALGPYV